jgi:cell fate (sporulation/competence/biofilm development) regulator YmcA (YheA/YmcA/DUF963 family)
MSARSTEMRKRSGILRKQYTFLLAENTKMNARFTEMRKRSACLLAKNTKINARSTEVRIQIDKLRKQIAILPIESLVTSNSF